MPHETYLDRRPDLPSIGKGETKAERKADDKSAVLLAIACDHVRKGQTFEEYDAAWRENEDAVAHVEKCKTEKQRERAVQRQWDFAVKTVEPIIKAVEDDTPKTKRKPNLEIFWGDADDGVDDLEPLIDGFFFKHSLSALYGQYGEGKSFVAADMGLCIASGRPWMGREVAQGAVMYFAGEGYIGLKGRRAAWAKHHRCAVPKNFALMRGSLNLQKPDGVTIEAMAAAAKDAGVVAIFLDTLNAIFGGGDENDGAAMSKARHELERLRDLSGAAVLIIHHAGKEIDRGLRGSSVLGGALDTALLIHKGRIISRAPKGKQKDQEPADDIAFVLTPVQLTPDSKGRRRASCVVEMSATAKLTDFSDSEDGAVAALATALKIAALKDDRDSAAVEAWRDLFYRTMKEASNDNKRQAFYRARMSLLVDERIIIEGNRVRFA